MAQPAFQISPEDQVEYALRNPDEALRLLDIADAGEKLRSYIPIVWPILEPGRTFVPGWSVDAICEYLQAVTDGEIRKVLINVPPGCMKSLTTCVLWPTWEWGPRNMPETRYITASYAQSLSVRDARKSRIIIDSDIYQDRWGDRFKLTSDQNEKKKYENDKRGFRLSTSVGGSTTGERGDRFIVDDAHNVLEAESEKIREEALMWFSEVVTTRVNDPKTSAFIAIMQRVNERDVSGMILAEELGYEHLMLPMEFEPDRRCYLQLKPDYFPPEAKPTEQVEVFYDLKGQVWRPTEEFEDFKLESGSNSLTLANVRIENRWNGDPRTEDGEMLWEDRFPRDYVEDDLKPSMMAWGGSYAVAGQLQQRPAPRGGGMFKKSWFKVIMDMPADDPIIKTVRGWDLAATKDNPDAAFTTGVKISKHRSGMYTVEDVVREQESPAGVEKLMLQTAALDGKKVVQDFPQDPGQAGKSQIKTIVTLLSGYPVVWSVESGSKTLRATPPAAQAEIGNIRILAGAYAKIFLDEITVYPAGQFKDQVDGMSRSFSRLNPRKRKGGAIGGGMLVGNS